MSGVRSRATPAASPFRCGLWRRPPPPCLVACSTRGPDARPRRAARATRDELPTTDRSSVVWSSSSRSLARCSAAPRRHGAATDRRWCRRGVLPPSVSFPPFDIIGLLSFGRLGSRGGRRGARCSPARPPTCDVGALRRHEPPHVFFCQRRATFEVRSAAKVANETERAPGPLHTNLGVSSSSSEEPSVPVAGSARPFCPVSASERQVGVGKVLHSAC